MHIGESLGRRYRLDERVDGGAMGEVWRGTDTRLNRTVAVKVLHAALSESPQFRKRFEAEARAAAALRAPGVVDLYDYGEDDLDDGSSVSYLVMEFVAGRPLSALLAEQGRIQPGEMMAMMAKCASALHAAHYAGVIHRDIKPGNILVRDDGEIKIVDFGIARANGQSGLTSTGQVMGTVAYVSPEQLYDEELTGASDIYSLGIVAYECLAGRKPFNADAPAAVIRAQLHEDPAPLPDGVPMAVKDLIARCLAKEPKDRWQSGAELSRACRDLAARLPRGCSTEPMDAVDLDDDEETDLLRASVPDDETRHLPAQSAAMGAAVPPVPGPDAESAADQRRRRQRNVAAVAAGIVLLATVTAFAWQPWDGNRAVDNFERPAPAATTSDEKNESDDEQDVVEDEPVEEEEPDPTSDEPTDDLPTDWCPIEECPTDWPSDWTSSGEPSDSGDEQAGDSSAK